MVNHVADGPIHPSILTLLELFSTDLASVKFPDVDKAVLEEAAEAVRAKAAEVAAAEAALEAARTALNESQESLMQKGQRALAYARIFAEENAELSAKLDTVQMPRGKRGNRTELPTSSDDSQEVLGPPKRRGRPAKQKGGVPLFADENKDLNGEAHAAAEQAV